MHVIGDQVQNIARSCVSIYGVMRRTPKHLLTETVIIYEFRIDLIIPFDGNLIRKNKERKVL